MKITIFTAVCIAIITFSLGAKFGRWDAKHGYKTGQRHGEIIRSFLKGFRGADHE